jgi:hypothetical protein
MENHFKMDKIDSLCNKQQAISLYKFAIVGRNLKN